MVCNYGSKTTYPVATKKPNELGIYDMTGNVGELCFDSGGKKYSKELSIDPIYVSEIYNPYPKYNDCARHVFRGIAHNIAYYHITSRGILDDAESKSANRCGARIALTK